MKERFMQFPDSFGDHEILELLLYNAIPRKDTNAVAHELLKACGGSLKKLCEVDESVLVGVLGVGRETCFQLKLAGHLAKRIAAEKPPEKKKFVYRDMRSELTARYSGAAEETFLLYLLDGSDRILACLTFGEGSRDEVKIDPSELAKAVIVHRPKRAVAVHNHLSGNPLPTAADDETTVKIAALFALHGVRLQDHIIVSGNRTYSYHYDGRLEALATQQQGEIL